MTDSAPGADPCGGGIGVQAARLPEMGLLASSPGPRLPTSSPTSTRHTAWRWSGRRRYSSGTNRPLRTSCRTLSSGCTGRCQGSATVTRPSAYLRASVVNGCRSVHRARQRAFARPVHHAPAVWSAESAALAREESRQAMQAVSRLPARAREVLALRYYLDLPDAEIAAALGISRSSVSSTASRALAVLARELKGEL